MPPAVPQNARRQDRRFEKRICLWAPGQRTPVQCVSLQLPLHFPTGMRFSRKKVQLGSASPDFLYVRAEAAVRYPHRGLLDGRGFWVFRRPVLRCIKTGTAVNTCEYSCRRVCQALQNYLCITPEVPFTPHLQISAECCPSSQKKTESCKVRQNVTDLYQDFENLLDFERSDAKIATCPRYFTKFADISADILKKSLEKRSKTPRLSISRDWFPSLQIFVDFFRLSSLATRAGRPRLGLPRPRPQRPELAGVVLPHGSELPEHLALEHRNVGLKLRDGLA